MNSTASWSLASVFDNQSKIMQNLLKASRETFTHPGAKGDASEKVWIELLNKYLPNRYHAESAFVVDSNGAQSEQIDVVIFDQQYSPFIFKHGGHFIIPAESVYGVFEVKQDINKAYIEYAQNKIASVRCLQRTSLPVPHVGGTFSAKPLTHILGGILVLDSGWSPAMGTPLLSALKTNEGGEIKKMDIGCIANHGIFTLNPDTSSYCVQNTDKAATAFIFELISQLQQLGTIPMIDISAYAEHLYTEKDNN